MTLAALTGWRRAVAAFALGASGVLAMPPLGWWPVLFVAWSGLAVLIDGACATPGRGRRLWRAARDGWFFGLGFFMVGLYWISASLLVDAARFAWLLPFSATLLPAGLALFPALATGLSSLIWSGAPARVLALAAAIGGTEWLRGHILTGFPWNIPAAALTQTPALAQSIALTGSYAASILVVAAAGAPAALLGRHRGLQAAWVPVLLLAVWGGLGIWGWQRIPAGPAPVVEHVVLRIVQPAIGQKLKWDPEQRGDIIRSYLAMTGEAPGPLGRPTLVIWPESALPVYLDRSPDLRAAVMEAAHGATLLTGMQRVEDDGAGGWRAYNSILSVQPGGAIDQVYDKLHLVPFGEYLPFQDVLEAIGISQLTGRRGGFTPGTGSRVIAVPGTAGALPLICYEIIFPGVVPAETTAGWILNVTNDAWFGHTVGPHQHLALARMRAIESGLPVVRAANTGISAVIDPFGRITDQINLGKQGTIDTVLPMRNNISWQAWHSIVFTSLFCACLFIATAAGRFNRAAR